MADWITVLNGLVSQTEAASAAQATSFSNLQNAITRLQNTGLDDEQRALVQQIETSLTKLGEDAQHADDGHEPTPEPDPVDSDDTPAGEPVTDEDGDVLPDARR